MDINNKVQNLLKNNEYYFSLKRKSKLKKTYWSKTKDPDGKIRDRLSNHNHERKNFLKNNKSLIRLIESVNFKSMCDVGCGSGYLLSAFSKKKFNLVGIDNDIEALQLASKYAGVFRSDLNKENLNIKSKFDLVVCYHVIEHVTNPNILIKNIYKILKKKGTLIIGTPDFDSAMARRFKNKYRMLHDKTHISLFSQDSLCRFLRDHNFSLLNMDFPYFDTQYFNKKELIRTLNKKGVSPPFYGNMMTVVCNKV